MGVPPECELRSGWSFLAGIRAAQRGPSTGGKENQTFSIKMRHKMQALIWEIDTILVPGQVFCLKEKPS